MFIFTIIGVIVVIWFIVDHTGKSRSQLSKGADKPGIEYNKLAMAFNGMVLIIKEINDKKAQMNQRPETTFTRIGKDVIMLAYLCRINILDRMEKYNWDMTTPIIIPNISSNTINLSQAYNSTVDQISTLSEFFAVSYETEDILEKGEVFLEFENNLPERVKSKLKEGM